MATNTAVGWSLIAAVIIGLVAATFTAGGFLIDPADSASFAEAALALDNNGEIAQFMTFLLVISVLLYRFGLHSLNRAFSSNSLMDRVSRFSLNVFLVGYAFLVIEFSIRHILTHVLQHGAGSSAAEEQAMATTLFAAPSGIHFSFLYVTSIGSTIFGYALARRSPEMSIFKLAGFGLSLTGLISFIVLMIAEHMSGIDLHGVAVVSNIVLFFGSLCILVIGVGIVKGRKEFVGDEAQA